MSQKPPYKKPFRIEDNEKYTRWGTHWPDSKRGPAWSVKLYEGNPRIGIYMNDGSKASNITIATDPFLFNTVMDEIIKVANEHPPFTPGIRRMFKYKNSRDHFNRPLDKPAEITRLMIGRNDKGCVYIAAQMKQIKNIPELVFGQNWWGELADGSGELLSDAEVSSIDAAVTANTWKEIIRLSIATQPQSTKKWRERQDKMGDTSDDRFDGPSKTTGKDTDNDFADSGETIDNGEWVTGEF